MQHFDNCFIYQIGEPRAKQKKKKREKSEKEKEKKRKKLKVGKREIERKSYRK